MTSSGSQGVRYEHDGLLCERCSQRLRAIPSSEDLCAAMNTFMLSSILSSVWQRLLVLVPSASIWILRFPVRHQANCTCGDVVVALGALGQFDELVDLHARWGCRMTLATSTLTTAISKPSLHGSTVSPGTRSGTCPDGAGPHLLRRLRHCLWRGPRPSYHGGILNLSWKASRMRRNLPVRRVRARSAMSEGTPP